MAKINGEKAYGVGNVGLAYPIESISRKLTLRKNTCSGVTLAKPIQTKYMGVAKLTGPTKYAGYTERNILFMRFNARTTPVGADELAARSRFAAVSRMVKARQNDLMHVTEDQEAFLAQLNQPGGLKSIKAWYWKVCGDEYDAQH